jgi:hypothetical protein
MPEECPVTSHSSLDLEPSTVSQRVLLVLDSSSVQVPSLIESIVTVPERQVLVVLICTTPDVKAESSSISDVFPCSFVVASEYKCFFYVGSDDCSFSFKES